MDNAPNCFTPTTSKYFLASWIKQFIVNPSLARSKLRASANVAVHS